MLPNLLQIAPKDNLVLSNLIYPELVSQTFPHNSSVYPQIYRGNFRLCITYRYKTTDILFILGVVENSGSVVYYVLEQTNNNWQFFGFHWGISVSEGM